MGGPLDPGLRCELFCGGKRHDDQRDVLPSPTQEVAKPEQLEEETEKQDWMSEPIAKPAEVFVLGVDTPPKSPMSPKSPNVNKGGVTQICSPINCYETRNV